MIAPTGTIGLVMDCDTTGIEPDFALVKFKKLAGGGYFKIINQSVPAALEKLGYGSAQIEEIVAMPSVTASIGNAPGDQPHVLDRPRLWSSRAGQDRRRTGVGFRYPLCVQPVDAGRGVLHQDLGIPAEKLNDPTFDLLRHLGFTKQDIEAANDHVCGTMTLEGAPYLKEEHYSIFDCANPCGKKGKRYLSR